MNERLCENRAYGSLRSTMFHEAVHTKYHDKAMRDIFASTGFIGGSVGAYAVLKKITTKKIYKSLSPVAGILTAAALAIPYHQFMEQRADMQGHQATNCSTCVLEEIQHRTDMYEKAASSYIISMPQEKKEELQKTSQQYVDACEKFECCQGYLYRSSLQKIAQNLSDKKCPYHLLDQK